MGMRNARCTNFPNSKLRDLSGAPPPPPRYGPFAEPHLLRAAPFDNEHAQRTLLRLSKLLSPNYCVELPLTMGMRNTCRYDFANSKYIPRLQSMLGVDEMMEDLGARCNCVRVWCEVCGQDDGGPGCAVQLCACLV
eukprot:10055-Chlamydomonas_euryale.AAC.3